MIVGEAITNLIQHGAPVAASVVTGIKVHEKYRRLPLTVGAAVGGWLGGWIAQRVMFTALEQAAGAALPKKEKTSLGALPTSSTVDESTPVAVRTPAPAGKDDVLKPPIAGNGTTVEYHE